MGTQKNRLDEAVLLGQKHNFKLIIKKIIAILRSKIVLNWPLDLTGSNLSLIEDINISSKCRLDQISFKRKMNLSTLKEPGHSQRLNRPKVS